MSATEFDERLAAVRAAARAAGEVAREAFRNAPHSRARTFKGPQNYQAGAQVMRTGSGALGLAYAASGRSEAYCELHMNAWDALAGLLLVEEAGGWVNDFLAEDGIRRGNPVIGFTPAFKDLITAAMDLPRR
jgi:fructose-1,6-bisphosphatase/inositol monophosphatase family enzyme